jgi:hypothetical protein
VESAGRETVKQKFMCWDTENSDEEDAIEREAWDAEDAAKEHGEHGYADDYPEHQNISVRAPDGTLTRWIVTAEPTVRFTVRAAKETSKR